MNKYRRIRWLQSLRNIIPPLGRNIQKKIQKKGDPLAIAERADDGDQGSGRAPKGRIGLYGRFRELFLCAAKDSLFRTKGSGEDQTCSLEQFSS
jgi:hypothetical protein